jgi:hypothetical protein
MQKNAEKHFFSQFRVQVIWHPPAGPSDSWLPQDHFPAASPQEALGKDDGLFSYCLFS